MLLKRVYESALVVTYMTDVPIYSSFTIRKLTKTLWTNLIILTTDNKSNADSAEIMVRADRKTGWNTLICMQKLS